MMAAARPWRHPFPGRASFRECKAGLTRAAQGGQALICLSFVTQPR